MVEGSSSATVIAPSKLCTTSTPTPANAGSSTARSARCERQATSAIPNSITPTLPARKRCDHSMIDSICGGGNTWP